MRASPATPSTRCRDRAPSDCLRPESGGLPHYRRRHSPYWPRNLALWEHWGGARRENWGAPARTALSSQGVVESTDPRPADSVRREPESAWFRDGFWSL